MKKLTLIGGAPISGKTTLSRKLAMDENAVELSTDSIRSWMRGLVDSNNYPELFFTDGLSAEMFYEKYDTPQKVMDTEIQQGIQVEKGVIAIIDSAITWDHLILEGIALSPEFMNKLIEKYNHLEIETIVLVDNNKERISERIHGRGLWGPLDSYPSRLIPAEVEWVVLYNKWFSEQSTEYSIKPTLI